MARRPIQEVEESNLNMFMPDAADVADGVKMVPAEMDTPTKGVTIAHPPLNSPMKARKPWKPKGRK